MGYRGWELAVGGLFDRNLNRSSESEYSINFQAKTNRTLRDDFFSFAQAEDYERTVC